MFKTKTALHTLLLSSLVLLADTNLHLEENMYAPAREMMQMQEAMDKEMEQLNQQKQVIETLDGSEVEFRDEPISELKEMKESYLLEKTISDANHSTVNVSIEEEMIKILITKVKVVKMSDFKQEMSTTNTEMHFIPFDADATKLQSSYKEGLLKITLPKKTK
ncbi:Hsp20/alpha crystallin family protein [bacterium]|nr:Hsp20/alpha crystallin family protein [bacterium]MBU1958978.1 Hsp20/alpha crystallin family protein [bacterium]